MRSAKLLTFALLIAAQGCFPGKIRKLEINKIGDVHLRSVSGNSMNLDIQVEVENPYRTSATLNDLVFTLALGGNSFGQGALNGPIEMPAKSSSAIQVPVTVDCTKVTRDDLDALFRPKIPFHLRGSVSVEKPVRISKVDIDAYGNLKAPNRIEVVLEDKSVLSVVSLKDTRIRDVMNLVQKGKIDLEVRNPFSFSVPVESMVYQIGLGPGVLADGKSSETYTLNPGLNRIGMSVRARPVSAAEGIFNSLLDQRAPMLSLSSDLLLHQNERYLVIHLRYRP